MQPDGIMEYLGQLAYDKWLCEQKLESALRTIGALEEEIQKLEERLRK